MNMIILLLFLSGAYVQYRALLKQQAVRDIVVSSCFLAVGASFILLKQFDVPLPSPMKGIENIFKPVETFVSRLLS
ncbi:hypothetical protein SAMN05216378_1673 [Paenibacillus catalpae]|uniref:Uncharacterized protein n=1 Tax=Paenibacillus catalpae TaxID=1045775 RepID=A0A1I1VMB5_9BACL|nr:hypothetical protein [Paenibacillus catalpae]SFD83935.1 hypothetical protein SAMN05216378_1673 [Paenibacillus catalpae]